MFNIIGSLFFGRNTNATQQPGDITTSEDATTQTSTSSNVNSSRVDNDNEVQTRPAQGFIGPLNFNEQQQQQQKSELDWVIVDRNEEADKLRNETGVNTSMIQEKEEEGEEAKEVSEPYDAILGSFFEKNEHDNEEEAYRYRINKQHQEEEEEEDEDEDEGEINDEPKGEEEEEEDNDNDVNMAEEPVVVEQQKQQCDWLITPLPCLTSITASDERSSILFDTDPLENLLIEHPSMSVFFSATSSSSSSSNSTSPSTPTITSSSSSSSNKYISTNQFEICCTSLTLTPLMQSVKSKKTGNKKALAEKRVNEESPVMKKKGKKSKKSAGSPSSSPSSQLGQAGANNKENMQVKTLLLNEYKKGGSASSRLDQALLNSNQMRRNNRNSTFKNKNNNNNKQRKYHKLQQPFSSYTSNQVF